MKGGEGDESTLKKVAGRKTELSGKTFQDHHISPNSYKMRGANQETSERRWLKLPPRLNKKKVTKVHTIVKYICFS